MSSKVVHIFPRDGAAARGDDADLRPSDRQLLSRVARGDSAAHRALFDRYYARVAAFLRLRVRDEGLCEELVSDVFFELWRSADGFRGDSQVHSWIFGIAHFKALAALRSQRQLKRSRVVAVESESLERFADADDPRQHAESRQEVRRLLRAISLLPDGQAEVLRLAFLEGRDYPEIAAQLGISEGNVKTRVNRARARLRTLLRRPAAREEGGVR